MGCPAQGEIYASFSNICVEKVAKYINTMYYTINDRIITSDNYAYVFFSKKMSRERKNKVYPLDNQTELMPGVTLCPHVF